MSSNISKTSSREQDKKVALITGSSSGIGANVAVDLAAAGYEVILTGRHIEKLNEVMKQCETVSSSSAVTFVADLTELEQVDKLVDFVQLKFNRLDVLINNVCYRGDVKNILDEGAYCDFEKVMLLNVFVPSYLSKKCLPMLQKARSGRGVIICITSTASQAVVPLHLYSISKACLAELSKQIALFSPCNIYSFSISPGPVLTEERPFHEKLQKFTLMKRVGETQEISNIVTYAINHAHLFNGRDILVDGGYMARQKQ